MFPPPLSEIHEPLGDGAPDSVKPWPGKSEPRTPLGGDRPRRLGPQRWWGTVTESTPELADSRFLLTGQSDITLSGDAWSISLGLISKKIRLRALQIQLSAIILFAISEGLAGGSP